eukprot:764368-Hanusia_phi.AAC.5
MQVRSAVSPLDCEIPRGEGESSKKRVARRVEMMAKRKNYLEKLQSRAGALKEQVATCQQSLNRVLQEVSSFSARPCSDGLATNSVTR